MAASRAVAGIDRVSHFLDGIQRVRREITTPEGVVMPVELAHVSERCVAFAIDFAIQMGAGIFLTILMVVLILGHLPWAVVLPVATLLTFFIRNGYFIYFELAWQGATPGKRIIGLRAIDRKGAPLSTTAAVARNLTREIETFMPLGLLSAAGAGGLTGWESASIGLWLMLFGLLPFFNKDRLRAGDFIAGTMVIVLPKKRLLDDLVESDFHYVFPDSQLRVYGVFELQVLEELLRRPRSPDSTRLRREVCDKIASRIGWPDPVREANVDLFLSDFYTAERAWLEREQLFGRHHPGKEDGGAVQ